jgi:hypothetical protein
MIAVRQSAARAVLAASALPPTSQQGHAYSGPSAVLLGFAFAVQGERGHSCPAPKTTTHPCSDKTGRGSGLRQPVQPVLGRVQSAQAPGNVAPLLEYCCRGREAGSSEFRPLDERTMANVRKDRRRRCPSLRSRVARVVRGRSQARCSGTGSLRARGQTKGHLQLSVKGRPCESSARGARPGPGSVAARARSRRRPHWRLVWRSPAFLGRVPQRQGWSARNSAAPLPCNPLALQSGLI